jgi:hypothetical protein
MSQIPPPNPSPNSQRDANGRFAPGNAGGPGNPFARQVAKLRAALVNSVREEDMEQIADYLRIQAKLGNLAAIKLLFQYVLGKPAQTVNPDTLDVEEWKQVYQPIPQIMKEMPETMMSLPVEKASIMVRTMQPVMQKAISETLSLPQEEFSLIANEMAKRDNERQESHDPPPSTNGSRGRKTRPAPSPIGDFGQPQALPPWLAKIAEKARLASSNPGIDPCRGG